MPMSDPAATSVRSTSFGNRGLRLSADLHLPAGFDERAQWPALVLATPGSSVKEQVSAIYGSRMAALGFVALTFDPAFQGESDGIPRDLEDPATRAEDIRCAVDHLVTLPFVDEDRIGLLGICAGSGYAIHAALTEHRFRAIGTVVAIDIGSTFRKTPPSGDLFDTLRQLGHARTAEARGAGARRDPWIPDSLAAAAEAGITDHEVLEAIRFYRESAHRHPRSTNRLLFRSYSHLLAFDAFHLVPQLLVQPLQVIVGGKPGSTGQYAAGQRLFDLSPARHKDLFVVDGAGHYDLYHRPEHVGPAVARLAGFYARHLMDA